MPSEVSSEAVLHFVYSTLWIEVAVIVLPLLLRCRCYVSPLLLCRRCHCVAAIIVSFQPSPDVLSYGYDLVVGAKELLKAVEG